MHYLEEDLIGEIYYDMVPYEDVESTHVITVLIKVSRGYHVRRL